MPSTRNWNSQKHSRAKENRKQKEAKSKDKVKGTKARSDRTIKGTSDKPNEVEMIGLAGCAQRLNQDRRAEGCKDELHEGGDNKLQQSS